MEYARQPRKVPPARLLSTSAEAATQLANPLSAVKYHAIERPIATALRTPAPVYSHGKCA
jgi:hypothetical protein